MASILLVEDELKIAEALRQGLTEHNYNVSIATDGLEGKLLYQSQHFDLAIIDVNLPRLSGLELCRDIRKTNKDIMLMALTAYGSTDNKLEGFEAGMDDYLVKPFEFRELLARIKALLNRSSSVAEKETAVLKFADLQLNVNTKEARRNNVKINLTPKEYQLLEYFMRNRNKVLSRAEIARHVWDIDFDTQTNMIDVYVNFLRKKIDKGFSKKLLHTLVGMGYILKEESTDAD